MSVDAASDKSPVRLVRISDAATHQRYRGMEIPEVIVGEQVHFFQEDPEVLYMRLEDVVRLLKRHGLPKDRWTEEEIDEARRRVDESTLKIEPAEPAAFDHLKRTGGW